MTDLTPTGGATLRAILLQTDRHTAVEEAAQWLVPNPNLTGRAKDISEEFAEFAAWLLQAIEKDSPQLTHALNDLVSAKDHAVRAILPSPI
jgi:hypothetical protein